MHQNLWITHETVYAFDRPVDGLEIRARLRPPDTPSQHVLESDVLCHPRPAERRMSARGSVDRLVVRSPLRRVELRGQSHVRWTPDAGAEAAAGRAPPAPDRSVPAWAAVGGEVWRWARAALPDAAPGRSDLDALVELFRRDFTFDPAATTPATRPAAFFARRRGVCQDYARLAAGCLAARGAPVRLVFGYLIREPAGGPRFESGQPHAWVSAHLPDLGWIDVDPTTGLAPPHHHVTLRRGRRLADLQPVSGRLLSAAAADQRLSVQVTVMKEGVAV